MKRRVLAMLLALSVSVSGMPINVFAEEEIATEEAFLETEDMDVIITDFEGIAEGEEYIPEEIVLDSKEVEMEENAFLQALEDESEGVALKQTTIGGSTYAFVDVSNVEDKENQAYVLTVSGRGGTTITYYTFAELTPLGDTGFYYVVTAGVDLAGKTVSIR